MDRLRLEMTDAPETSRPRCIWLTLEGPDIIEMKQVVLDRDAPGAAAFFRRVVAPRVRAAAKQRGILIDGIEADEDECNARDDERLPG